MNFCSLDRFFGAPERIFVSNEFSWTNLVNFYNGKRPCFMSTNRFEGRNKVFSDRIVTDFDSDLSWRIPYKEVAKLYDFCRKKDIPEAKIGSGGKGFHHYMLFQEEPLTDLLNSKIFSIQYSLKKYFNFQSADEPLFGKKGLLIRIPTTRYVRQVKKGDNYYYEKNDNYCRYLSDEEFEKGVEHIEQLLKEPGIKPEIPKQLPTLDDIVSCIPDYKYKEKTDGSLNLDLNPGGVLVPSIETVGLPCLQSIARQPDPKYEERLELAVWLKLQGYRDIAITSFYKNCKWKNFDTETTLKLLNSIKPRFPKCSFLRKFSGCENCSFRR